MQKRLKTGSKPPLVLSAQENKHNTETQGLLPNIPPCGTHHKFSGTILAIICPLNRRIISCKQYKAPDHIVFVSRLLGPKPARIWHRIFGEVIQMGKFCLRIPGGEVGSPGNSALLLFMARGATQVKFFLTESQTGHFGGLKSKIALAVFTIPGKDTQCPKDLCWNSVMCFYIGKNCQREDSQPKKAPYVYFLSTGP